MKTAQLDDVLEIWVESRGRPVAEPEIVIGARNMGRLPSDWISDLAGTLELLPVDQSSDDKKEPMAVDFSIASIAPQETGFLPIKFPGTVSAGRFTVRILSLTWVQHGKKRKHVVEPTWEMVFFDSPPSEIPPFTTMPLRGDDVLFQDPFMGGEGPGSLVDIVRRWYQATDKPKALGFYGEIGSGKTTILYQIAKRLRKEIPLDASPLDGDHYSTNWKETIPLIDEPRGEMWRHLSGSTARFIYTAYIRDLESAPEWAWAVRIPWLSSSAVQTLVDMSPVWMDRSVTDKVLTWTGGHPFLVQALLFVLSSERWPKGYATQDSMITIAWSVIEIYRQYLARIWGSFSILEQYVLITINRWHGLRKDPPLLSDIVLELEQILSPTSLAFRRVFPDLTALALTRGVDKAIQVLEDSQLRMERLRERFEEAREFLSYNGESENKVDTLVEAINEVGGILRSGARWLRLQSPWLNRLPSQPRAYILQIEEKRLRQKLGNAWEALVREMPNIERMITRVNANQKEMPGPLGRLRAELIGLGLIPVRWVETVVEALVERGWVGKTDGRLYIRPKLLDLWIQLAGLQESGQVQEPWTQMKE